MLKTVLFAAIVASAYGTVQKAIVVLGPGEINGTITFTAGDSDVTVEGTLDGLPQGKHGFHIHEKGDLSHGCTSAGGHFNPSKKQHGAPGDDNRHVGDLGNIEADDKRVARIKIVDKLIALNGANSIIGRAVVVHADPDDLGKGGQPDSKTTGHAGDRLACGIIGIANETQNANPSGNTANASTGSILMLTFTTYFYLLLNF